MMEGVRNKEATMTQDEINEKEWGNPDNWAGPGFYFSKRDSRVWVPKSIPWMGWTLNIARPMGAYLLLAFIIGIPLFIIIISVVARK
jgi:uncharacterized membrane protein